MHHRVKTFICLYLEMLRLLAPLVLLRLLNNPLQNLSCRNLPRANVLGVMITTVIYLLVNISYLTAMTSLELLNSQAVAVVCKYHSWI